MNIYKFQKLIRTFKFQMNLITLFKGETSGTKLGLSSCSTFAALYATCGLLEDQGGVPIYLDVGNINLRLSKGCFSDSRVI